MNDETVGSGLRLICLEAEVSELVLLGDELFSELIVDTRLILDDHRALVL